MMCRRCLFLASLVMGLALALASCGEAEVEMPAPIRPVLVTTVKQIRSVELGPFTGIIEPRYRSQLGFRIGGRIIARDINIGDYVKKGTRLAALDPFVSQLQLNVARADVANAQAQLANASAVFERQSLLLKTGNTPQSQLDQAVATRDAAAARLLQAQASLDKARDNLSYNELKADYDGVVTSLSADMGQVVAPGQAVVTIARPDIREAVFDVPDALL